MARDLLGRELTGAEGRVLALYEEVKRMLEQDDLPPGVQANLRAVLAHLWQAVNNLDLEFEQLYHPYGV